MTDDDRNWVESRKYVINELNRINENHKFYISRFDKIDTEIDSVKDSVFNIEKNLLTKLSDYEKENLFHLSKIEHDVQKNEGRVMVISGKGSIVALGLTFIISVLTLLANISVAWNSNNHDINQQKNSSTLQ